MQKCSQARPYWQASSHITSQVPWKVTYGVQMDRIPNLSLVFTLDVMTTLLRLTYLIWKTRSVLAPVSVWQSPQETGKLFIEGPAQETHGYAGFHCQPTWWSLG
jgi:hypothetical protein